jgi:flagellin-like protein
MNFARVQRKSRKAISPVLATVILIAITLIAAVAIAGFVFGLFGTFTSTAQVQASVTSCVASGSGATAQETCNLVLTNSGNANTQATTSCSLTFGGKTVIGVTSGAAVTSVPAGSTALAVCTGAQGAGNSAAVGSQVTGSIILTNGGNALFSATGS